MWIVGTILAATLERWWFPAAWDETGLPASRFYFGDTRAFLGYATALAAGQPFDNGVPFHPPGWPIVLSLLYRVFGWSADLPPDPLLLKHVVAMMSGVSVGVTALVAWLLGGRRVMIIASLLGIFSFGHIVQAAAPNSEPLYGLLMGLVLLGTVRKRTPGWLLGILAGFTTLVRAEFAICAGALAFGLASDRDTKHRYRRVALFAAGFMIALLPNTIFNWRSIDEFNRTRVGMMPGPLPRFAPVTSYGPFNFANANHEGADGAFNWNLPGVAPSDDEAAGVLEQGQLDLARPAVYRAYVDGYWMGARWMASNPASAMRMFWKKLAIMQSVFDYGYLLDNVPAAIRGTRRPVDQIDLETSWLSIVHVLLAIGGLWIAAKKPVTRLLLAPVLTLLASTVLFFGYVRLGAAYLPVVWILQALAITRLLKAIRVGPRAERRAEFAAAALVAVLLLVEWSAVNQRRVLLLDGLVDADGRLIEDQRIEIMRVR